MNLKNTKSWQIALIGSIAQLILLLTKTPSYLNDVIIFVPILMAIVPTLLLLSDNHETAKGGALLSLLLGVGTLKMGLNMAGWIALVPWFFFVAAGIHWYTNNYSMIKKKTC